MKSNSLWLLGLIPVGFAVMLFGNGGKTSPATSPNPGSPPGKPPTRPGGFGRPGRGTIPVVDTTMPNPMPEADLPLEQRLPFAPEPLPGQGMGGGGIDGVTWANSLAYKANAVRKAGGKPRWKGYDPAREEQIVQAVKDGHANYGWSRLVIGPVDDTYLTLPVFSRGLRVGTTNPVQVEGNFLTAQRIADLIGGAMLTPLVSDEIYKQGTLKIEPILTNWSEDGTMASLDGMVDYSASVDKKVPQDLSQMTNPLVANDGFKDWVLTKRFWSDPIAGKDYNPAAGRKALWSANYGGYTNSANSTNQVGMKLHQPVGLAHNFGHTDYSQKLKYMGLYGMLSGKHEGLIHVGTLLRHPTLHKLLSYEGPLPSWKHPAFSTGEEPPPFNEGVVA